MFLRLIFYRIGILILDELLVHTCVIVDEMSFNILLDSFL